MSRRALLEPSMLKYDMPPCGALAHPNGSVCWRVWAPMAHSAELVLYGSTPAAETRTVEMQSEPGAYFTHTESVVDEGQEYSFRLDGGAERPDPASRWQPHGVHRPSAVTWLDRFNWSEGDWPGLSREKLVIYELHVGTFTS